MCVTSIASAIVKVLPSMRALGVTLGNRAKQLLFAFCILMLSRCEISPIFVATMYSLVRK